MNVALPESCRDVCQRLTAYIDGELSPKDTSSIERHIIACAPCGERASVERGFTAALRARQLRDKAPAWLTQKVRQAIEQEAARETGAPGFFGWLGGWKLALAGSGYALALIFAALWIDGRGALLEPDGPQVVRQKAASSEPLTGEDANGEPWVPVSMRLQGQIVCAMCEEAGVPINRHILCDTYGHFNGLRDERGRVWQLVRDEGRNLLLQAHDMRGRTVDVEAEAFEDVGYLIARNVHEL